MIGPNVVMVELGLTRLGVTRLRGGADARTAEAPIALPADAASWASSVRALAPRLRELAASVGAEGAWASVIVESPTATCGVFACPSSVGRAGAIQAARLALGESSGLALDEDTCDACVLGVDGPGDGSASRQIHTLAAAERDESLAAVADLLAAAGLRLSGVVPAEAVMLADAVRLAWREGESRAALALHLGDHSGVLAAAERGRLCFVRRIGVGVEALAQALALSPGCAGMNPDEAAALLERVGMPAAGAEGEDAGRVDRARPQLQPVLQRVTVEVRQSLRFGMSEAARTAAHLVLTGRGAGVPRLADVIVEPLGLAGAGATAKGPASSGRLVAAASRRTSPQVALLPRSAREGLTLRRAQRGVAVGAALALLAVVADGARARHELAAARSVLAKEQATLEAVRPLAERFGTAVALSKGVDAAKARSAEALARATRWDAALAALSRQTPPGVALSGVTMSSEGGRALMRVQGRTTGAAVAEPGSAVRALLDGLAGLPIVESARLGATQRVETPAGVSLAFELTATLLEVPHAAPAAIAGVREDQP